MRADCGVAARPAGRTFPVGRVQRLRVCTGPKEGAVRVANTAGWRGDGVGDAFAAGEAGADELVGVGAVGLGARGADRGAAVAAGHVEHPVRHRRRCARVSRMRPVAVSTVCSCPVSRTGAEHAAAADVGEPAAVVTLRATTNSRTVGSGLVDSFERVQVGDPGQVGQDRGQDGVRGLAEGRLGIRPRPRHRTTGGVGGEGECRDSHGLSRPGWWLMV